MSSLAGPTPISRGPLRFRAARRPSAGPDTRGFTLVELMIVTVIIGILAVIAAEMYSGIKAKAAASTVHSDIRRLPVAVETHLAEHGSLPSDLEGLRAAGFGLSEGVCVTEYETDSDDGSVEIRLRHREHDVFYSWKYPDDGAPEEDEGGGPPWSNGRDGCLEESS